MAISKITTNSVGAGTITQPLMGTNVAGNGPAFSAYQSTLQSVSNNTYTKVSFQTEEFDTNSNYDTANYRFTPTVAGYYQVNGAVTIAAVGTYFCFCRIYKNGVSFKAGGISTANTSAYPTAIASS